MSEFVQWKESDVIERFGVPKDELVAFRKSLTEGEHWERMPQGSRPLRTCPIIFTENGWNLVVAKFGLIEVHAKTEKDKPAEIKVMKPAEADQESVEKAEVIRCDYPNRRVMLVKLENGKSVFCNVFFSSTRLRAPTSTSSSSLETAAERSSVTRERIMLLCALRTV